MTHRIAAARATRGRGKKLLRGQSCASNPETRKHRDRVSNLLLAPAGKINRNEQKSSSVKTGLTRDLLEKFDAVQEQKRRIDHHENDEDEKPESDDIADEPNDDRRSAFSIGNISAASIWSNCSNVSFDRFLGGFDPKSRIHKSMLTVLATVRDAIGRENGTESETEYFSGLMLTLNCVDSEEKLTATLALILMVMKRVPVEVLRLKFSETSAMLMKILSRQINKDSANSYLTKSIINALSTLLQCQELALWELKSTQQIFDTMLMFVLHQKPKIRKAASFAVISLVCDHKNNPGASVAARLTAEFCIGKLEDHLTTTNDEHLNLILYILSLLSDTMAFFPTVHHTKRASEAILSHMTLGNVLLVSAAFKTFVSFFLHRPAALTPELNARILNALYEYQPNVNDEQPLNGWCEAMKEGLLCLHQFQPQLFGSHAPKFIRITVECLQNENDTVHRKVCAAIQAVVKSVLESESISDEIVAKIFTELEACLKYQYSHAWTSIIPMFTDIFGGVQEKRQKILDEKLGSIMQRLAIIYESNDHSVNSLIESFFGTIIRSRGPRFALKYCPVVWKMYQLSSGGKRMATTGDDDSEFRGEFTNAWLMPIIRQHAGCGEGNCEMSLFVDHFLPMADELKEKIVSLQKMIARLKNEAEEKSMQVDGDSPSFDRAFQAHETCLRLLKELKRCIHAMWALLPPLCRCATDVPQVFPRVARRLGETLYDKEFRIYSIGALRQLLNGDHKTKIAVGQFAKNFLPILFNIYTNEQEATRLEEGLRPPVLILIQHFVPLLFSKEYPSQPELFQTFCQKIRSTLAEMEEFTPKKSALLDIFRAFLHSPEGFTEQEYEDIYVNLAKKLICESKSAPEQKKGFQLIEELISSPSVICENFVKKHLTEILGFLLEMIQNMKKIKSPSARVFALRPMRRILEKFLLANDTVMEENEETKWKILLEQMLPSVMGLGIKSSSKAKKCSQEMLETMDESFEKLLGEHNNHLISLIINPTTESETDDSERASRLVAITHLYHWKYHYPIVPKSIVSDIADFVFKYFGLQLLDQVMVNACFEFTGYFLNTTTPDLLNSYLEVITCGITSLPIKLRAKFHFTVKVTLTKLMRKVGSELIQSMVPEDYQKVVRNIRKLEERKKKKKALKASGSQVDGSQNDDGDSDRKSMRSKKSKKFMTEFSDDEEEQVERLVNDEFDDDHDDDDGRTQKSFKSKSKLDIMSRLSNSAIKNYIREEVDGDPIDLLSTDAAKSVFSKIPKKYRQDDKEDTVKTLPVAQDGRLNINELLDQLEGQTKRGLKRPKPEDEDEDGDSDDDGVTITNKSYRPGGRGIHRPVSVHQRHDARSTAGSRRSTKSKKSQKSNQTAATGDVYRSKNAPGDMKRRGMPDPYAYFPLDPMSLNKRKALKQKGKFKAIVKGAMKGAAKGKHLRNKRMKSKK